MDKNLEKKIKTYYDNNLDLLSRNRFHYLSRKYAFTHNKRDKDLIRSLESMSCPENEQEMIAAVEKLLGKKPEEYYNKMSLYKELRYSYYQKYEEIFILYEILCLYFFSKNIFGKNHKNLILSLIQREKFKSCYDKLITNLNDVTIIATIAVNYLILCNKFLKLDSNLETILINKAIEILGKDNEKPPLLIKLYYSTHIIIASSEFYFSEIESKKYLNLLQIIEDKINKNYNLLSLDIKLELLCCNKIAKRKSFLREKIYQECINSFSSKGNYIIDKQNLFTKDSSSKDNIVQSEHRNTLFLINYLY